MQLNKTKIKQHLRMPLPVLVKLVWNKLTDGWINKRLKSQDSTTDVRKNEFLPKIKSKVLDFDHLDLSGLDKSEIDFLVKNYSDKRFSFLGIGWKKNVIDSTKIDSEGSFYDLLVSPAHKEKSKEIWKIILNSKQDYIPINWQCDFKSDQSFSTKIWYKEQLVLAMKVDALDIKVPWELSRLQHLVQLALFASNKTNERTKFVLEFKCQVLDFIAGNPYNMGANWNCAMDVGIRAANLLVAFDLFIQQDEEGILDEEFKKLFTNYVYLHGIHLTQNFEYKEGLTSNHYLGNVVGLAFISFYLEGNEQLDAWLLLSIQELSLELDKQFFEDGSNFEGSTSYHRLSGEFFVITVALLNNISEIRRERLKKIRKVRGIKGPSFSKGKGNFDLDKKELFSSKYYTKLFKMLAFTKAYTKPNGKITQIGDNDSGRFFKFSPNGELISQNQAFEKYENLKDCKSYKGSSEPYFDEDDINHETFTSLLEGMFSKEMSRTNRFPLEFSIIKSLMKSTPNILEQIGANREIKLMDDSNKSFPFHKTKTFEFKDLDLLHGLTFQYFQDFGFLVFKSDNLYLSVRCNKGVDLKRLDGHLHNDLLSIELSVGGKDICVDPGTYIYTANPTERNRFRRTSSHNTIYVKGIEQRDFSSEKKSLFYLEGEVKMELHYLSKNRFIASLFYKQVIHRREIIIEDNQVVVNDSCNHEFEQNFNTKLFSNGYGKKLRKGI